LANLIELYARRAILSTHLDEMVQLEQLVISTRGSTRYSGFINELDPEAYRAEVIRTTDRLVAIQLEIEEIGGEE